MRRTIRPDQVTLGMYIHAFEGSWLQHPFWRTHFLVNDEETLRRVRESDVAGVLIDEEKGAPLAPDALASSASPDPSRTAMRAKPDRPRAPVRLANVVSILDRPCSWAQERARATRIAAHSAQVMRGVFDGVRLGKAVRSAHVVALVDDISASVARHPHTLIGITRLKSKDEYTYLHSVAVCALMVNFARRLDLDPDVVRGYGLAGLLHDVGKMAVPDAILNKPGALTDDEFALVRDHPERGHALLQAGNDTPDLALDVCLHHHEKIDGSGYPFGLKGEAISLAARMGAICDVYDALTSNRAYKNAWAPAEAVAAMRGWAGHFDPDLLFTFMQSIAVFPVGMLVRLRSNRLAIVLDNGRRASRPKVRAFYSTTDHVMIAVEDLAITDSLAGDQIIRAENPLDWGLTGWEALRDRLVADPDMGMRASG